MPLALSRALLFADQCLNIRRLSIEHNEASKDAKQVLL